MPVFILYQAGLWVGGQKQEQVEEKRFDLQLISGLLLLISEGQGLEGALDFGVAGILGGNHMGQLHGSVH